MRGTVIRTVTIDSLLQSTLKTGTQVVNLGCGFDTRSAKYSTHQFYEVDLPEVIHRKQQLLPSKAQYIACDLNDTEVVVEKLITAGLSFNRPIIILAECCLMYLQRNSVANLLDYMHSHCHAKLDIITFDAIQLGDGFGKRMSMNLPVKMPLFESCRRVDDYLSIFSRFQVVEHFDMRQAETRLDDDLLKKLGEKCALDEVEEWHLIASHYIFCRFTNRN